MARIKAYRSVEEAKELAWHMAIETGYTPEIDFIWAMQESEEQQACFGRISGCRNNQCRWRSECTRFEMYALEMTALSF